MTTDERYMARCLQLAANGRFFAAPNPMVGAVIVHEGKIIGEGYHRQCGGPHAEVNAVRSVKDERLLHEATMYVNLEPCAHYGKTPPCADMIVEKGIPRVVIGCRDSFDQVDGRGIEKLRAAGVEVTVGVLEHECLRLNQAFFTYHGKKRPYITLKWAQSTDGYMDVLRTVGDEKGTNSLEPLLPTHLKFEDEVFNGRQSMGPVRFSNDETAVRVHRLRALNDAILVGRRTAELDNPSLTTRLWPGTDPLRLVIDRKSGLDFSLCLFDGTTKTTVFTEDFRDSWHLEKVEQVKLDFSRDILPQMMQYLYERKVQRLLVEGGSVVLQSFINNGLWDEAFVEEAPFALKSGVGAPRIGDEHKKEEIECFGHRIKHFLHENHIF